MSRGALLSAGQSTHARKARRATTPLAYARLWTPRCNECGRLLQEVAHPAWKCVTLACSNAGRVETHTSQKSALAGLGDDATAIFGGNGTGKTELGAQIAVATAAGRKEPWVQQWAEAVGFPLHRLPNRPGRVCASALTSHDSRRFLRPKLRRYLPAGCTWRNEDGTGEAEVTLPNGGVIVLKSNDQGRRSYQGDWFDLVWLDEEHEFDVFEECEARVARVPEGKAWILLTMTPLKGFTWVYETFLKAPAATTASHFLDAEENPWTNLEKVKRWLSRLSPAKRAARKEGRFASLEGTVYDFDRELHLVKSFEIPQDWPRYRGIDFGVRHPFCCLWVAWDRKDDVLHIYRELYRTQHTTRQNGETILEMNGEDEQIEWTTADPADLNARLTLLNDCGISTDPAPKAIQEGINAVTDRMRPDAEGRPHLVVHDCCINTIREFDAYKYPPGAKLTLPVDLDNHAMDVIRYVTYQHQLYHGGEG